MPKYFSGRVKRTPQSGLTSDRYQYLGLDQAEPNLGDPPEVDNIPPGQQYQIVSLPTHPGERFWKQVGGGVVPGAITVREEGSILPNSSGISSITDINIKGNILTAEGYLDADGNPGTGVTITAAPVGNDHEVLFNNNGEFGAASGLSYDNTNTRVGIASTQPQETLDIDGTLFITGNVFDKLHDSGDTDQVLVKSNTGGLVWADQSGATAVAAGHTTQVQFHNNDGNLGGAENLVYDYTNNRIGIGSTQPTKLLDVLGDSKFTGTTDFDGNVNIDGVLTYEDVTNVDSIGVVTAGKGVRITSEGLIVVGVATLDTTRFPDNTSLYFGDDDDLQILHDGSDSIINDNATGSLKLQQGGNTRLEVTGMGVTVSGVTTTNVLSVTGLVTSHLIPSPPSVGSFNLGSEDNRWDYVYVNNIDTGSWNPVVVDTEQLRVSGLSTFIGLTRHQDGIVVTSGVSTFVGFTTFNNHIFVAGVSTSVGVSTFHSEVGIGGSIVVAGLSTFIGVTTSKSTLFAKQFSSGISSIGIGSANSLYVSGLSTFVGFSTFTNDVIVGGASTFVGLSTFSSHVVVGGMSTFVGISTFKSDVGFEAGIKDKDGDLGDTGWLLESTGAGKVNWVNPQGLTVENATKIGVGSVYGGTPLTSAGINTHFITFVDSNNPIDGRENELLYTTGLFVYDPIGQRVGIGTTIPSDTLSVSGITSFKGDVYFAGIQNNIGFTSLTWQSNTGILKFQDEVKAYFGNGNDLRIYHTEELKGEVDNNGDPITNNTRCSYIHEKGSGGLVFKSDGGGGPGAFQFFDQNWNPLLKLHSGNNARALLYHNGTERLLTTDVGVKVSGLTTTGSLRLDGAFYDSSNSYGANSGYILQTNQASGVEWVDPGGLAFEKANKIGIGSINAADVGIGTHFITFVDTNNPHDGRDYELLYSTGLFVYDPQDGGRVGIGTTIPSDTLSVAGISSFNGEVYFNSGVTGITSIGWNPSNSALEFKDNVKATFGDGNDLQIYHDTNDTEPNSVIEHNNPAASALYLSSNQRVEITDENHTNLSLRFNNTGDYGTELFHATNKKFETSGVGVTVYGSISIYDSDNTNKITLQPPATSSLTADYALTLPVDDGGPNEVLTTDGSGVLSWTTKAAGTAVAAGSNQQVQYNNNNVLAGAAELLFDNSTTAPTLILKPNVTTTATNGGYIQVRNAGSTNTTLNAATITHDGGLELKRTNETVTNGGPYIDLKYDATDMDARIQMDIASGTTSDDKFSAITFSTGGGGIYDSGNTSGRLTEKIRIGKDGEIGIQGGAQVYDASSDTVSTNNRTSAQIYGTSGQVLKSNGLGASVYWGDEGTGSGISAVEVKQYSDDLSQNDPRTVRSCDALDAPITVSTNSGTAVIGIGSTSNAYGNRYIGDTEPTGNLCEGDIWYDTSSAGSGGVNGSTGITKVAKVEEIGNYGNTGAGSFTGATWVHRNLTDVTDPKNMGITVSGNIVTIPAGTYSIRWSAPAMDVIRHVTRLAYSSTSATVASGVTYHYAPVSYEASPGLEVGVQTRSTGFAPVVTFTSTTYIKIEHYAEIGNSAGDAMGAASPWSSANASGSSKPIWTTIEIEDLATAVKESSGTDGNTISVKDYGAVGDGSNNDTAAIKSALAAGSGVNRVYFPAGTYIVHEPIIIPSNTYVKGSGALTTVIKMSSTVGKLTGLGVIGDWDTTTENVIVEDISFDFNTARWHGYIPGSSSPQEEDNATQIFSTTKSNTGTITRSATGIISRIELKTAGKDYTSAPTVEIAGGGGSSAAATAVVSGISRIDVSDGGQGFQNTPTVNIGGPDIIGGVQATAVAHIDGQKVIAITITNPGEGYTSAPSISFTGGGSSVTATATAVVRRTIIRIDITNAGSGYASDPTVTITPHSSDTTGSGADAAAVAANVVTVPMTNQPFGIGEKIVPSYETTGGEGPENNEFKVQSVGTNQFTYHTSAGSVPTSGTFKALVNGANRNALTIYNSKDVTLNRVRCLNANRHCLDITSSYRRSAAGKAGQVRYYETATYYSHKGAQNITVNECYFEGAGDDNLTTHCSSDILITNCHSNAPRGGFGDGETPNTNCFEVDDGSRNVQIYNCKATKGNNGLQIKGHGYAPAAYNVIVDGMEIINCVGGVECHHSGWITYSTGACWQAYGGGTNLTTPIPSPLLALYDADGQLTSLSENGYSATANNVTLSNIQIIAPSENIFHYKWDYENGADTQQTLGNIPTRAFELSTYAGVQINDILVSDGTKDRQLIQDGYKVGSKLRSLNTSATYSQSGTTVTVTKTDHGLSTGDDITIRFTKGGGVSGNYTVASVAIVDGTDVFTYTAPNSNNIGGPQDCEYTLSSSTNGRILQLFRSARNWSINNFTVNGYHDKADTGFDLDNDLNGSFTMNNITFNDGPLQAIYIKGDNNRYTGSIDNYTVHQTKPTSSTTWDSLVADSTKYAIRSNQPTISIGKGNIKGYPRNQGLRPLLYTPKIYTAGTTEQMVESTIDTVEYRLDGSICTVFVRQFNLGRLPTSVASGDLRISLPFKPFAGGGNVASVFTTKINFANNYVGLAAVLNNGATGFTGIEGYAHIRGMKDDGTTENINANLIGTLEADYADVQFTASYEIDENFGTNIVDQW